MKRVQCRIPDCFWTGAAGQLLKHCEADHPAFVKAINLDNGIVLTFDEVLDGTFLLAAGREMVYWFLKNPHDTLPDTIQRGIFSVDDSKTTYTIKVGKIGDSCITYSGSYQVQPDGSVKYDLQWSYSDLACVKKKVESNMLQIFLDVYDGGDMDLGACEEVVFNAPPTNKQEVDKDLLCGLLKKEVVCCKPKDKNFSCFYEKFNKKFSMCEGRNDPTENWNTVEEAESDDNTGTVLLHGSSKN